jgi:hypothetical protein
MVNSTQFPRDATSAERKKLWNPSETLGIFNPDCGSITCIGHAPSKRRRCQNPINKANRNFISETLNAIAYLHPDSSAVMSRLRTIAGPALCVRYHQNQAETVLMQWQRKLQQLKPEDGERSPAKNIQSNKNQQFIQDPSIRDLKEQLREMRELLARLQEDANSQRHQYSGSERGEAQVSKDRQEEERKRRRSEEREREARKEKERLERERLEKERLERERLERERLEKERRKREEQKQREREREQAADNERTRQRAQKKREERAREKREKEQKEREEWDQLWTTYQERWVSFRASASTETNIRDAIPWPVKSGSYRDVKASNVKQFFQKAVPADANVATLMRKECLKWHPDMISRLLRDSQLNDADKLMIDVICTVVTDSLNSCAGRSAPFLG